jgi:hypothetical protein
MVYQQRNTTQIYVTLDNKNVAVAKFYYSYQIVMYFSVKMTDWQKKGYKTRKL